MKPFVQAYNLLAHYFNEFAFFAYLCVCMTFTDYTDSVPTRKVVANVLTSFMFVIIGVNLVVCMVAVFDTYKHRCMKKAEDPEETRVHPLDLKNP
jgi:heme/copper-type cytochrome/quinol oxidase subunit 2